MSSPVTAATAPAPVPFGARLHAARSARGPLVVGLDPHDALLTRWGLSVDVAGLAAFCATVVETLAGRAAVLKPQIAFFERHGPAGLAVLAEAVAAARSAGALVLLDAKRGDIGSTVQAYADAYLDQAGPLPVDAITASPYLGFDALAPLLDTAATNRAGVFVLALTSNPQGRGVQLAVGPDGRTVAAGVAAAAASRNAGAVPLGSVGLVVGATAGADVTAAGLDLAAVNGPLLAPGLGAQGGQPADLAAVFGSAARAVWPSTSRALLGAGPRPADLVAAFEQTRDQCASALGV